jgi:RHS repeat-associated protein
LSEHTYYLYDGNVLLATFDEDDAILEMFVNGPSGRIASYTGYSESNLSYYLTDHLGTARVVISDQENGARWVQQYFNYHPFGEVAESWGIKQTNFKFTGKELDDERNFDHYYFGARYYNPERGSFSSVDKAGQFASGFAYGNNNPIMGKDPDGNRWVTSGTSYNDGPVTWDDPEWFDDDDDEVYASYGLNYDAGGSPPHTGGGGGGSGGGNGGTTGDRHPVISEADRALLDAAAHAFHSVEEVLYPYVVGYIATGTGVIITGCGGFILIGGAMSIPAIGPAGPVIAIFGIPVAGGGLFYF